MSFRALPAAAAWLHREARAGFEVAFFSPVEGGWALMGSTTAVEDGMPWIVDYEIHVDTAWHTRHARVTGRSAAGTRRTTLEGDGRGHWRVDGRPRPSLEGCHDVDLESSAMTNTLPVHRLALAPGCRAAAPAAYVRASDLRVERLEQGYARVDEHEAHQRYRYAAPAFGVETDLVFDAAGLVLAYPGIAVRTPVP